MAVSWHIHLPLLGIGGQSAYRKKKKKMWNVLEELSFKELLSNLSFLSCF